MAKSEAGSREQSRAGAAHAQDEGTISHSVAHETRLDALSILHEREASPKEIQKALGVSLSTASHHVKELLAADAIELVRTEPRRGAVEHFYQAKRAPEVDVAAWKELPAASRRGVASVAVQAVVADILASLRHGKLESDDDLYIGWMRMDLSPQGEDEVTALEAEILERYKEIKARDGQRVADEGCDVGRPRIVATLWFERAGVGRPL